MQLSSVFVSLVVAALAAATPTTPTSAPIPSPPVSPATHAKLEAIFADMMAKSKNGTDAGALAKRSVHCETSGGSPSTGDSINAAHYIQGLGNQNCCNENGVGSYCTTMYTTGSAAVGICSTHGLTVIAECDYCWDAGNGLLDIANTCSSGGRSGGWADAPPDMHLILFHS